MRNLKRNMRCSYDNRGCSAIDVERTSHSTFNPINKSRNICSFAYSNILNLLLIWIFCASCFLEHGLGETSRPFNRAAAKGERVQLNCSTQEPENGYWEYTQSLDILKKKIYNGVKVVNGMTKIFSVNDSVQGRFNLIFDASESTYGRYMCQQDLNMNYASAEVIVLDTAPICSMIKTSDIVNASCVIDFNGNWAPKIQWHNMNGRLETNDTTTVQNSRVTSFLIVPANQTDNLTCTPTFVLENKPQETTATNLPVLHTNCTLDLGSPSDVSSTQPTTISITTTDTSTLLPIVMAVVCALTIIVAVSVVLIYLRQWRRTRSTNEAPESLQNLKTTSPVSEILPATSPTIV